MNLIELEERCAKAAYEAVHANDPYSYAWDDEWDQPHESTRQRYYKQVRAVIAVVQAADAAQIAELVDLLCLADELLMDAWGAYPLPYNPNRERMNLIREITGSDYHTRKERARAALEKLRETNDE